jgi:hypothetical protein
MAGMAPVTRISPTSRSYRISEAPEQDHAGELVPPERPLGPDGAGGEKYGGRRSRSVEQGCCMGEVVAVAVVEGDGNGLRREPALLEGVHERVHREDLPVAREHPQLVAEARRSHGEAPGVHRWLGDPVIHQDHRARSPLQAAQGAVKQGRGHPASPLRARTATITG